MNEIITGVGLILTNPSGQLVVVRERTSKPAVGKVAGMITFPLETVEEGEHPEKGTLPRLLTEEVGAVAGMKRPRLLGFYHVTVNTVTIAYVARCESVIFSPAAGEEVEACGWMYPLALLTAALRRPEVDPILSDYLRLPKEHDACVGMHY